MNFLNTQGSRGMAIILSIIVIFTSFNVENVKGEQLEIESEGREAKGFKMSVGKAIVPQPDISVLIGHSGNLSCLSENQSALRLCRWEHREHHTNRKRYIINVVPNGSTESDGTVNNGAYSYIGQGLNKGDCTISINNVTDFHRSEWECFLVGMSDNFTWIGTQRLDTIEGISTPYLDEDTNLNDIVFNEVTPASTNVTCCVSGGLPSIPVKFDVHIENVENATYNHISRKEYSTVTTPNERTPRCKSVQYTFAPADNGKLFVCTATYNYNLQEHALSTSVPIQIKYGPKLSPTNHEIQHIDDSGNLVVTVEVTANPKPTVIWFGCRDVDIEDSYFQIGNNEKYKVNLTRANEDNYLATLTILGVDDEDYTHGFKISVSNAYGTQERKLRIVIPQPEEETEAYWLMIIIGGGCVLLLGLIIVVAVCICRAKDRRGRYIPANQIVKFQNSSEIQDPSSI